MPLLSSHLYYYCSASVCLPYRLVRCQVFNDFSVINAAVIYWFTRPFTVPSEEYIMCVHAIYLVNFIQNILTTGLVVVKILRQHHISTAAGTRSTGSQLMLSQVLRILIECSLVYTVQLFALIILYFQQHNAQLVVRYAIVPSIGGLPFPYYVKFMLKKSQELSLI